MSAQIEDVYPLAPMQQGMLFHSLQAPEAGLYVEQLHCVLRGPFDAAAFAGAWRLVVARHAVLRTSFVWEELDEPLQVVHAEVELPIVEEDWRALDAAAQTARLATFLDADRRRGFELAEAPLMRLALFRTADQEHAFVWTHHHLLLDGWSVPILFQEVLRAYEAARTGTAPALPPVRPYRDYIAWLQEQDADAAEAFWRRTLAGISAPTPFRVDRPAAEPGPSGSAELRLSAEATAALQQLGRQYQLTPNTFVQGAWALLLAHYAGEEDVVFGATVAGRPAEVDGAGGMVGLFINTLPVRAHIDATRPAVEWLRDLQAAQAEMRQFEYSPLVQVQGWSEVPRGTPLFESIVVFENYPLAEAVEDSAADPARLRVDVVDAVSRTELPLLLEAAPGAELMLRIVYDSARFAAVTVERMLGHLGTILRDIAGAPEQPVGRIALLTEAERLDLVVERNAALVRDPVTAPTVMALIDAQVRRDPAAVAVRYEGADLTYGDLAMRANRLARHLQALGVGPEVLVGLCLERTPEAIVAMLAILKAGGAYLPLDPGYPRERLAFMLGDARPPVVVSDGASASVLPGHDAAMVLVDRDAAAIAAREAEAPGCEAGPESLAYVIYTSGSTGRPKGALLAQRGLCNFVRYQGEMFGLRPGQRMLQFASLSFDASVAEILSSLANGATLVMTRREVLASAPDLHALLQREAVTTVALPPTLLHLLPESDLPALDTVVSAGERCPRVLVERWGRGRRFVNGFGPTETTVCASLHLCDPAFPDDPPIGRGFPNQRLYVVDRFGQLAPVGVPGELWVGGAGLARGYLNRPDLTAERFVEDRFADDASRLYRTGDLVRWREDGLLEYMGRIDDQVKIRGFRIELGEIEAVLALHPRVRECVVLARGTTGADARLVGYVVPAAGEAPDVTDLRDFLGQRLPDYMVPAAFVVLDAFPLSPTGKVDRRGLPDAEGGRPELRTAYVAPRNATEEILANIMAGVLNVERVGIHDDFFALGGHSLLVTQVVSRIREALRVELPLRTLFEAPTVAALSKRVRGAAVASGPAAPPIEPANRDGKLPLSFAQQRLWFLDQLEPGSALYNNPAAVRLTGRLDVAALRRSLETIVRRHDSLRTVFATTDGQGAQVVVPEMTVPLEVVALDGLAPAAREAELLRLATLEAQQPFDLAAGPLLRATLLRLDDTDHVALLTMHHIVSDGWSMNVLVREVAACYEAHAAGHEPALPPLPIQYPDFAAWQRRWFDGVVREKQLAYWKAQLAGAPALLELPTDRPRPAVQSFRGRTTEVALPAELSRALTQLSRRENATLFMTLLAAWQTLLARYSGQDDVCVGTPIANRTRAELEGLIGFFVNTLVLRTDLSGDPTFRELLARVRESALGAYAHQDMPFEMVVDAVQPERDLSHTPLFQVMLVLGNAPAERLELPGLTLSQVDSESGTSRFDLTLALAEGPDGLGGTLEYNTDLFDEATVRRMMDQWRTLLEAVVADPDQPISALALLDDAERQRIVVEWNDTAASFPADRCMHQLVEAHAAARPGATAVLFGDAALTYAELDRRANQLARHLRGLGVERGTLVGLCVERSPEMVVGILGIQKAGGAYLPLDPRYPADRLAFMLADADVPVLLTQEPLLGALPPHAARTVCLDRDWPAIAAEPVERAPGSGVGPDDLAYVIYTSGSTGRPKGTLLEHRGVCNLAAAQRAAFGIGEGTRVLQFSALSFDASVWETVMALGNGGTLVLAPQETLASAPDLTRLLVDQRIDVVTLPPSLLTLLDPLALPALGTVIAAGEACTTELVARWAPGRRFFNAYGPTETTVCATMQLCDASDLLPPAIGRPLPNTRVYVLDRTGEPVPVGVPGELHVGGVGLARGYLNRDELTRERFVTSAFDRLYRTGDLVRWRADGRLEFLGRIDHQVKLRGFRIELGEVEAALRQYEGIEEALATVREDAPGAPRLVGYLLVPGEADPAVPELRAFLRERLPEYMVPSAFVTLRAWPLTPSGKIDRKALPAPEGRLDTGVEYVAPRTPLEETLAGLCAELLGLERVGVHDNFFELGGHSLLATQLMSRVREAAAVELPLRALFEDPTVAGLAAAVERAKQAGELASGTPAITALSRDARRAKRSSISSS